MVRVGTTGSARENNTPFACFSICQVGLSSFPEPHISKLDRNAKRRSGTPCPQLWTGLRQIIQMRLPSVQEGVLPRNACATLSVSVGSLTHEHIAANFSVGPRAP